MPRIEFMPSSDAPNWIDPNTHEAVFTPQSSVSRGDLFRFSADVVAEPLVAQRLITAGQRGLALERGPAEPDFEQWGHSLASAIAVLLPPPETEDSSAERRKRRQYQERWLNSQRNWPDLASRRSTAYLVCSDNRPPEIGLPRQLYPGTTSRELVDFQGFYPLLDALIQSVSPVAAPAWINEKPGAREALVTIIAETFKNTHDHARHEVDKSDVAQSLRGLYARFYDVAEISKLSESSADKTVTPALRYARGFLPPAEKPGVRPRIRMPVSGVLEISVFDSGPGMAAKWLGRQVDGIDVKEQLEAVIACFEKGRTTTGTQGRGYGLAKVLLKLKELRAFISVRTNEIHVYRQFSDLPSVAQDVLDDGTRMPAEKLFDWQKGWSPTPSAFQSVRGTVVSFLIPMAGV